VSDIGPNSNRRQVALAVSALQDNVGATGSLAADVTALEAELAIAAGPQALLSTFLGDPLLRKVLTVAAGPNSSTVATAHGITTPSKIVGCIVQLTNGTLHLCFGGGGYFHATGATGIQVTIDATNVNLISGASGNYSAYAGSIILIYVD
jgi:hypothetical protein